MLTRATLWSNVSGCHWCLEKKENPAVNPLENKGGKSFNTSRLAEVPHFSELTFLISPRLRFFSGQMSLLSTFCPQFVVDSPPPFSSSLLEPNQGYFVFHTLIRCCVVLRLTSVYFRWWRSDRFNRSVAIFSWRCSKANLNLSSAFLIDWDWTSSNCFRHASNFASSSSFSLTTFSQRSALAILYDKMWSKFFTHNTKTEPTWVFSIDWSWSNMSILKFDCIFPQRSHVRFVPFHFRFAQSVIDGFEFSHHSLSSKFQYAIGEYPFLSQTQILITRQAIEKTEGKRGSVYLFILLPMQRSSSFCHFEPVFKMAAQFFPVLRISC